MGGLLLVTATFCAAPHLHPEAVLGLPYHRALDFGFHGGYYFVVTLLLYRYGSARMGAGLFYLALLAMSAVLEVGQEWVPGRSFSYLDLAANTAGISAAFFIQYGRQNKQAY